jgi:rhodanese-related sulfurtransferase
MGPLVPDVITNELNLIVAILIGVGFGFILEQAGFSSSRKLTGLFYGTDFTVLRVFFTAGATAMTGVVLLSKQGWLDASVIFVNPTFVYSGIVGGVVMGFGFVIGGFCPGTSLCALAVGRLDAAVFAAGTFLGVFVFGEAYPRLRAFYLAGSMGDLTVPQALGVPAGVVALVTIAVAVGAFVVVGRIERRVNPDSPMAATPTNRHRLAAAGLVVAGIIVAVMPSSRDRIMARAADAEFRRSNPVEMMPADELAFRLLDGDLTLRLVDVRAPEVFAKTGLPGALNVQVEELFGQQWWAQLAKDGAQVVFIGDTGEAGEVAAAVGRELGLKRVAALEGGYRAFRASVLEASPPEGALRGPDRDTWAFRIEAAPKLAALIKARSEVKVVAKPPRKIAGGCGM